MSTPRTKSSHFSTGKKAIGYNGVYLKALNVRMMSKKILLNRLQKFFTPTSVVDLGCGYADWLVKVQETMGIKDIHGYDIPELPIEERRIPASKFTPADLSKPFKFPRKWDLAISTEVGEHLPPEKASNFVKNLCKSSDVILFSAATPLQGGMGHLNENWIEYWYGIFTKNDYVCFDIFRNNLWHDRRVHFFYRQNTMLYVSKEKAQFFLDQGLTQAKTPRSFVHPEHLIKLYGNIHKNSDTTIRDVQHYYESVDFSHDTKKTIPPFGYKC